MVSVIGGGANNKVFSIETHTNQASLHIAVDNLSIWHATLLEKVLSSYAYPKILINDLHTPRGYPRKPRDAPQDIAKSQ